MNASYSDKTFVSTHATQKNLIIFYFMIDCHGLKPYIRNNNRVHEHQYEEA